MDVARQPGPDRGALPLRRVPVDLLARVLREEGERGDCVPALDGLSAPDQGGGDRAAGARHPRLERDARLPLDRKSTRLNSSHMSISYAVFCLKKKKKKNTTTIIQTY